MNLLMVMMMFLHLCWRHIPFIEHLLKCTKKIPIEKKTQKALCRIVIGTMSVLIREWPYRDNVTRHAYNVSAKEIKTTMHARCVL